VTESAIRHPQTSHQKHISRVLIISLVSNLRCPVQFRLQPFHDFVFMVWAREIADIEVLKVGLGQVNLAHSTGVIDQSNSHVGNSPPETGLQEDNAFPDVDGMLGWFVCQGFNQNRPEVFSPRT
jgi:hypothetical protein